MDEKKNDHTLLLASARGSIEFIHLVVDMRHVVAMTTFTKKGEGHMRVTMTNGTFVDVRGLLVVMPWYKRNRVVVPFTWMKLVWEAMKAVANDNHESPKKPSADL